MMLENEQIQEENQEQAPQEEAQSAQPAQATPEIPKEEGFQAKNFRTLKEQKERVERERDEALYRLQQLEAQKTKPQEPEEDEIQLGQDDIAEGKHINRMNKRYKQEIAALKVEQAKFAAMAMEAKIRAECPDYEKVVTKDAIQLLKEREPEIAQSIAGNTDQYAQAISAYKMIKKFGIVAEDTYQSDRERVQNNANKPKPLTSISPQQGDSPLSHANAFANGLTPELQQQLWKEMQDAQRNH